jgi:hypothetical protein
VYKLYSKMMEGGSRESLEISLHSIPSELSADDDGNIRSSASPVPHENNNNNAEAVTVTRGENLRVKATPSRRRANIHNNQNIANSTSIGRPTLGQDNNNLKSSTFVVEDSSFCWDFDAPQIFDFDKLDDVDEDLKENEAFFGEIFFFGKN